mgnify:CR=1 FL=1
MEPPDFMTNLSPQSSVLSSQPSTLNPQRFFVLILVAYLALGVGFAVRTPAWQAPDEPAHYNYIAQVAANGCCPVIEMGDWDKPYLDQLTASRFRPDLLANLSRLEYEDHQPPLYYLIAAPVYALTSGSLTALRLLSVVVGAGVVWCAFAVGRVVLPERPQIALGAAAFVAFLPQHVAMLAAVNNDGLAELVIGLALLLVAHYLKGSAVQPWHLGILMGIGLLTKVSTLFLVGLAPLAMIMRVGFGREAEQAPPGLWIDTAVVMLLLFFSVLLHEFGHAVYSSKNMPRELPYVLRGEAHILTTEGIAMMFERLGKKLDEWAATPTEATP